jgi:hypothetical protein
MCLDYAFFDSDSDVQELLLLSPKQVNILISLLYAYALRRDQWCAMSDAEWDELQEALDDALFELGTVLD